MHFVLGSSFAQAFGDATVSSEFEKVGVLDFQELGLVKTTVPGHQGQIFYLRNLKNDKLISLQLGRLHGYEGHSPQEVVKLVMGHKLLGTNDFILTNAAGSLKTEWNVGSAMVISDHINFTGLNPLVGKNLTEKNGKQVGPRFPDMAHTYDVDLQKKLFSSLEGAKVEVHRGIYFGLLGPSFETAAEIQMFSKHADVVGMSTVWEAISLKHAGARIGGISLVTNWGTGLSNEIIEHEKMMKKCEEPTKKILKALLNFAHEELN